MFFIKKTDDSLRFCVDYRDFNEITIKNNLFIIAVFENFKKICLCETFYQN